MDDCQAAAMEDKAGELTMMVRVCKCLQRWLGVVRIGGCDGGHGGCQSLWMVAKDWDADDDIKGLWVAADEREKLVLFLLIIVSCKVREMVVFSGWKAAGPDYQYLNLGHQCNFGFCFDFFMKSLIYPHILTIYEMIY